MGPSSAPTQERAHAQAVTTESERAKRSVGWEAPEGAPAFSSFTVRGVLDGDGERVASRMPRACWSLASTCWGLSAGPPVLSTDWHPAGWGLRRFSVVASTAFAASARGMGAGWLSYGSSGPPAEVLPQGALALRGRTNTLRDGGKGGGGRGRV